MISSGCSSAVAQATTSVTCFASVTRKACIALAFSETRQFGEADLTAMHMHAPKFCASAELWEDLARIEQRARVKGALQTLLLIEVNLVEHRVHQVALLDADTVLPGQHPTDLDAKSQNIGAEGLGAIQLAFLVRVVHDQRMQVAVA